MTELDTREDDWARGVFDRVRTGQHEPHWIPDAAAAARLSGRRRTRHRAAGALAAVAIAGLSAAAFTTLGGSVFRGRDTGPVSPAAGPTTTWNGLDLTKYLEIDGVWRSTERSSGNGPLSATGLGTISTVLQRLDPGLKHIRTTSGRHQLVIGPAVPGTANFELRGAGYWAPIGDVSSFPPIGTPYRPTTPFGHVDIETLGSAEGRATNSPDMPCGVGTLVLGYGEPQPTAWSACARTHQADGSDILIAHSTNLPAGTVTVATRVFPGGSLVRIIASTVIGYSATPATQPPDPAKFVAGPPLNPVPWTDQSLAQALTGPEIKRLP